MTVSELGQVTGIKIYAVFWAILCSTWIKIAFIFRLGN